MVSWQAGATVLAALILGGCGANERSSAARWWTVERLVDPAPREFFRPEAVAVESVALDWSFAGARGAWPEVSGSVDREWPGPGLRLVDSNGQKAFEGGVAFDSAEVDELEVTVARKQLWAAVAYWAEAGGPFGAECSLRLTGGEAATDTVRFPVASHPCWRGRIGRLRFVIGVPEARVRVLRVRAVRRSFPPDRAAELDGSTWRLDVNGEVRDARLVGPESSWRAPVELPPRARLAFAHTLGELADEPVEFVVSWVNESGRRSELYRHRLEPSAERGGEAWRPVTIELGNTFGRAGSLVFDTRRAAAGGELKSMPAWGDVRLQSLEERDLADVALLSVDTWRGDRLSLLGYARAVTPRIDAWARRSAVCFPRAFAPSPWTLPSHVTMFTGLDPVSHGVNSEARVPENLELLTERLRAAGYRTVAITGGGYLHPRYRLEQGFDSYRSWSLGQGVDGELVDGVDRALALLREGSDEALFLFFHTYEVHFPYHAREPHFSRLGGAAIAEDRRDVQVERVPGTEESGYLVTNRLRVPDGGSKPLGADWAVADILYDSGVAYADQLLGDLLSELEARSSRQPVLTILTSDHGEALGERGLAFHAYPYDFNLHVPLLVAFPGGESAGSRREGAVGLVDLAPTILGAARLEAARSDGIDLARETPAENRVLWAYASSSNWGLTARLGDRWKILFNDTAWAPLHGRVEAYASAEDLHEVADTNLRSEFVEHLLPAVTRRLANELSGLHVQIASSADQPLRGALRAPQILAHRVKSPDRRIGASLEWLAGGGVGFALLPGEALRLIVHTLEAGEVRAWVEEAGLQGERILSAEDLRLGVGLQLDPGGWRATPLSEAGDASLRVSLRWVGDSTSTGGLDEEEELAEQLRALGYL